MGRGSQLYWAINAEKFPDAYEQRFHYTHIDLSGELGEYIKKIRREKKKLEKEDPIDIE